MSVLRFFALFFSAFSLSVLISCSNQTSTPTASAPASPVAQSEMSPHSMHSGKPKININNAILSELDKIEAMLGVPALSNRIQASRPYAKVDELVSKNVITQAQFDQVKDMVTIEDIQLTGEAKDVDFMTKLGLMKGHMLVAKELLDLQKPDQAEPHIGHPVEEIYADVEDQLNDRNIKEFKTGLIALQDTVKAGAKDANKVDTEFKTSMQAVDGAIAALPETQRTSPDFVLQTINGLLDTANSEYTAAIADGKISQAIEYQDSRGFVIYANELYKAIAPQMAKDRARANTTIQTTMAELMKAWPSVLPPATPVKTPVEVSKLIKTIEQSAQKTASS
ncbi:DNA uptake protein [Phormidesmis priestleyi ULC007]|uniref:DNA uptake protein n=1 Tax=Phormidesmis priestleyi ULC007 TaxID=1920490 RepID=A0A2T1DAJ4_9CYAN|nr:helix-hairpin-helix domain-containing protein [Phormidesmis priestleyi]PSB17451.1 DNA uptake protein [Phormidesmis priestleyi ULC007]PZO48402.1 MAG: DNA uptake protein [Phormidesmis priestleyi]